MDNLIWAAPVLAILALVFAAAKTSMVSKALMRRFSSGRDSKVLALARARMPSSLPSIRSW